MTALDTLNATIATAPRLWLFLDYDGTLDDFAPTPDEVYPNPAVIEVLTRLQANPRIRPTIISGRRLAHIEQLVPLPGILLAGTYGIELRTAEGAYQHRVPLETVRPILDALKSGWAALIRDHAGFYLEDKNWALALHARYADDALANHVLTAARALLAEHSGPAFEEHFRVLGGHKFLEIGPQLAHKGRTLEYLLDTYPCPDALLVYVGDDDKDEEAFAVIQAHGGLAVVVGAAERESRADYRLPHPQAVHAWLQTLL